MRSVVNISLPAQLARVVDDAVKSGNYASKSEFFRNLLRLWMDGKLIADVYQSRQQLKSNQGKLLHSLKDLR